MMLRYMVQQLKEYGGKSLKDVTKAELELLESDDEKREEEEERRAYEATCTNIKQLLGERVEKVVVSHRVVSSPCVLVTAEFGWSTQHRLHAHTVSPRGAEHHPLMCGAALRARAGPPTWRGS